MIEALVAGVVAGLAIAVPVGAIGILIIETGIRRGFRVAWAAGAGTASADCVYATVAAAFGTALAGVLAPWERPLRVAAVMILVALAGRGFLSVRAARRAAGEAPAAPEAVAKDEETPSFGAQATGPRGGGRADGSRPGTGRAGTGRSARNARGTYLTFLGLTLMNPQTVVYFAALILGLGATGSGPAEKAAFVVGAFGASLAWQSVIAIAGAVLHRRLSPAFRTGVSLAGNLVILAFALAIARDLAA